MARQQRMDVIASGTLSKAAMNRNWSKGQVEYLSQPGCHQHVQLIQSFPIDLLVAHHILFASFGCQLLRVN